MQLQENEETDLQIFLIEKWKVDFIFNIILYSFRTIFNKSEIK